MSNTLKIGVKLFIITIIAAFCLGLTNYVTREPIEQQRIAMANKAKRAALPKAETFVPLEIEEDYAGGGSARILEVSEGRAGDDLVGHVFKAVVNGYKDEIEIVVGINTNDRIEGVEIGRISETPGLGSKVKDRPFLDQFVGKNTDAEIAAVKNLSSDSSQEDADTDASASATGEGEDADTDASASATGEGEDADTDASASATGEGEDADTDASASATGEGEDADTDASASATGEGEDADTDASASATGEGEDVDTDASASATPGVSDDAQQVEAISGATISSNAVAGAINMILDYYNIVILEKGAEIVDVLPQAEEKIEEDIVDEFSEKDDARVIAVSRGETNGEILGYVYTTVAKGFHDDIEVFVGINSNNEIEAVGIGKQSETMNLGTKVTEPEFLNQYTGEKDIQNIDTIANATISSSAVNRAVDIALDYHNNVNSNGGAN